MENGSRVWCFLGVAVLWCVASVSAGTAEAEDELMDTTKHPVSVTMAIQADTFFGFNPSIYGTYGLTKDIAFAFNTTYWTDVQGLGVHDNNPWLEIDAGVNLTFLDKRLSVTPLIGAVHGQLLSSRGGAFPKGGGSRSERSTAFEGIVPNITVNWLSSTVEAEFYMGYYKSIRSEGGAGGAIGGTPDPTQCAQEIGLCGSGNRGTWDFLHWWGNAGYRINSLISIGGHYEQLLTTRDSSAPGAQQDFYRWIGPYVEMKLPGGMAFRFTTGKDLTDNEDFYKLKFTKTF